MSPSLELLCVQVIRGSTISDRFTTFGYSLSGGRDVDGNKYPDLLVGSLDHTVALLRYPSRPHPPSHWLNPSANTQDEMIDSSIRTRPVVQLNKTLRVWPEIIDPNNCDFW